MPAIICSYGIQPGDWLRPVTATHKCHYIVQTAKPMQRSRSFAWDATLRQLQYSQSEPTTWPPARKNADESVKPCAFSVATYPIFSDLLNKQEELFADIHPRLAGPLRLEFVRRRGYHAVPIAYAAALKHGWLKDDHMAEEYGIMLLEMSRVLRDAPDDEFGDLEAVINHLFGHCILGVTSPKLTPVDLLDLERKRRRRTISNWGLLQIGPVLTHWIID
ncbi:MAG: hypothetical protein AAB288_12295 [Acidobacteriota bacterium]